MSIVDRTLAVLPVDDIETAERWYQRFFGRPADATPMPSLREWHDGSGGLAVLEQKDRAGKGYAILLVESIEAHRADLTERGLTLGERQPGDQGGVAQIDDSAGNTITLAQRRIGPETAAVGPAAIVRSFVEAFRDRRRQDVEALMSPSFTFTSQYDDHIDRDAFFERCWPAGDTFAEMKIERITPDSEGAFITYFATTKSGASFRNTEYLRVSNGKVQETDVYFGAEYNNGSQLIRTPA